jgi:hypothetical protein
MDNTCLIIMAKPNKHQQTEKIFYFETAETSTPSKNRRKQA